MSTLPQSLPTAPIHGYFGGDIQATSGSHPFLCVVPSSTIKISNYFRQLADEWQRDTGHLSLISQRVGHPAYKRIVRMGGAAIPLILEELQHAPGHWFHALITLADENPVPADFNGTVADAADLWVAWGQRKNLIDH